MTRLIDDVDHLKRLLEVDFSDEQVAAITAPPDRPQVIVAGAGSGKTTVMAARVVWLVGHHEMPPGGVLGLTFTKKAAAELGRRVRRDLLRASHDTRAVLDLFDQHGEPTVATYHAFAGSLIAEHGLRLGLETDLHVAANATRYQRAARVIRRYREPLADLTILMTATIERVLALDANLSEHLVTPDQLREHDLDVVQQIAAVAKRTNDLEKVRTAALERIALSRLVEAYRAEKQVAGVADFSDQMAGGARLAIECPEVGEILRERFSAVMLDEYQDTSVAQRRMLQGLFGEGHPVTAVGDPAQGIYGWRGASADNIERFAEHFPLADGSRSVELGLRTSRRCHPAILAVANEAAAPFYATRPMVEPLVAPREEPPGGWGDAEITAERFETVTAESAALVDRIGQARADHPEESVAVLLRTKGEMPALTAALRARGVDAEVVGLAGLLTLPHVSDVVALLDVVADATANPSLLRLLTGARWRIGPRDLALLGRRAQQLADGLKSEPDTSLGGRLTDAVVGADPTEIVSLADALDDPGDLPFSDAARSRFAEVASAVRTVRRGLSASVADVVRLAVRVLDLDVETALLDTGASADLTTLIDVAEDLGSTSDVDSLPGFVAYLRAEEEFGTGLEVPERSRDGAVQILTIHAAKGLEWHRVFVPFVVDGTFPSGQGRERWVSTSQGFPYPLRGDYDVLPRVSEWTNAGLKGFVDQCRQADADEEVRLAYVAFTRAKRALHVSGHWWGRTQKTPRPRSPFLEVVRDQISVQMRPLGTWADEPEAAENPELDVVPVPWPAALIPLADRQRAADLVRAASSDRWTVPEPDGTEVEADELAALTALDRELAQLATERSRERADLVPIPRTLSATAVLGLADDEAAFARALARPLPRRPSPAARFGTRFHAWIETHYGQQPLLDPSDLPGAADRDVESDAELAEVIERFLAGPYADRVPLGIEVPFSLVLEGQHVIGRIDAVFEITLDDGSVGYEVVDWKTGTSGGADPLQLALYRVAWAEQHHVPLRRVVGVFAYVRLGDIQRFDDLPGRAELEALLS